MAVFRGGLPLAPALGIFAIGTIIFFARCDASVLRLLRHALGPTGDLVMPLSNMSFAIVIPSGTPPMFCA